MAIESGHQVGRSFQDQNSNQFMNGASFSETEVVITGDGAIDAAANLPLLQGVVHLTKGSAAAITLKLPTAIDDDGKVICVVNESGQAHVITQGTDGFNAKGSSGTVTFTATAGTMCWIYARNGHWWVAPSSGNITIA